RCAACAPAAQLFSADPHWRSATRENCRSREPFSLWRALRAWTTGGPELRAFAAKIIKKYTSEREYVALLSFAQLASTSGNCNFATERLFCCSITLFT